MSLAQVWRGTLARLRYRRTKAALTIVRHYRRHKVRAYLREVVRRFRDVRLLPDRGRSIPWPAPPKVLRRFEEALQDIYHRYRPAAPCHCPRGHLPEGRWLGVAGAVPLTG